MENIKIERNHQHEKKRYHKLWVQVCESAYEKKPVEWIKESVFMYFVCMCGWRKFDWGAISRHVHVKERQFAEQIFGQSILTSMPFAFVRHTALYIHFFFASFPPFFFTSKKCQFLIYVSFHSQLFGFIGWKIKIWTQKKYHKKT